jgi:hypothetical protein
MPNGDLLAVNIFGNTFARFDPGDLHEERPMQLAHRVLPAAGLSDGDARPVVQAKPRGARLNRRRTIGSKKSSGRVS